MIPRSQPAIPGWAFIAIILGLYMALHAMVAATNRIERYISHRREDRRQKWLADTESKE